MKKECHWKNTFHINVTSPKDLSCDSIIDLDQMHGTSCPALCSMLACSYRFLCGQIFFLAIKSQTVLPVDGIFTFSLAKIVLICNTATYASVYLNCEKVKYPVFQDYVSIICQISKNRHCIFEYYDASYFSTTCIFKTT